MPFRTSIQYKILALLLGLALPPLALVAGLSLISFDRARTTALQEGAGALQAQAEEHLGQRALDKARLYDLALDSIEQQVESVAAYLRNEIPRGPFALGSERVWVAPAPSPELIARYAEPVALTQRMIPTLQATVAANPLVSIGYVALDEGGIIAFDKDEVIDVLLTIQPFDPRTRPWYLAARAAGTTVWSDAYVDANTGLLTTTCATPIYDLSGRFIGVVAFDLLLQTIQQDILSVDIGPEGYALLLNETGQVIVGPDMDTGGARWDDSFRGKDLLAVSNPELRAVVEQMIANEDGVALITDNGQSTYIAFAPVPTAGWSVALVIPAEQVSRPALETGARIEERQNALQRQLQLLLGALGLLITALGLFLAHSFTRRITAVRQGVQAVAGGDLNRRIPTAGSDEIGQLVDAFNGMADVLQDKLYELEENTRQLATLNTVSNELKGIIDLQRLLESIPAVICDRLGFDRAVVYLVEGEHLKAVAASFGLGNEAQAHEFMLVANAHPLHVSGRSVEADVIRSGKAIIVDNPWNHPGVEPHKQAVSASHDYVQVPIFGREGRVIGLLSADCHLRQRPIVAEDASRLLMFAGMVGLTIQNVQLLSDLEQQVARRTEELRDALAAAQLADRRKSDFLASLSHELRTPLNAIIGFSTVMLDDELHPLTTEQREDLTSINRNGRFLLHLITELLDLAKIEAGHLHLEPAPLALTPLIHEVADTVQGLIRNRPLRMVVQIPADLPLAYADDDRVRQVLLNLLSNAVKFTERGMITLSADILDELDTQGRIRRFVRVRVADTGLGIPLDQQAMVFQEFVQIHGRHSRVNGTGLGLAIARRLIDAQHGRIWVESVPGAGSTFSFTLPVAFSPVDDLDADGMTPPGLPRVIDGKFVT
ncbi:MAG: cache domain-containing protein [Oscillochloridaceae bacterium umkhey_bin13]